ncbi:class IV adenylate cyclase [Candidatus Aerophobetes bacterium]|nr:class IV adenylate cyclase [Candidatus Aerophobetes bacterium]
MLEVELKAKIEDEDKIEKVLLKEGATFIRKENQVDTYFSHPCRDFGLTDEAFRVREVNGEFSLTFKGPRVDRMVKTRREIEVKIEGEIFQLLRALGFSPFKKIIKERKIYEWRGLILSLDKVENLGFFLEVEGKKISDKEKILNFMKKLGIKKNQFVEKSYFELIMEKGV